MHKSYPMTQTGAIAKLENFKVQVDNAVKMAINYKKVGGMHHWRVGRLGGSVYIKKAAPKVEQLRVDFDRAVLVERMNRFIK
jgi:hypothetical protein